MCFLFSQSRCVINLLCRGVTFTIVRCTCDIRHWGVAVRFVPLKSRNTRWISWISLLLFVYQQKNNDTKEKQLISICGVVVTRTSRRSNSVFTWNSLLLLSCVLMLHRHSWTALCSLDVRPPVIRTTQQSHNTHIIKAILYLPNMMRLI